MVPGCFKHFSVPKGETKTIDCPVAGKGFKRIRVRMTAAVVYMGIEGEEGSVVPGVTTFEVFDFSGYDNTAPKTLVFTNTSTSSDSIVHMFVEEVGSNPV